MTREEFLEALRKTPRDWNLVHGRLIRRVKESEECQCPITSLRNVRAGAIWKLWGTFGLSDYDMREIIDAADDNCCDKHLRAQLLEACGLTEQA